MKSSPYPILGPVSFGRELVDTGDLDPIYLLLADAYRRGVLGDADLHVACFVYWLFYDLSTVSRALDANRRGESVLAYLRANVAGTELRRGPERRHFRGKRAEVALDWFIAATVEGAFEGVHDATTFKQIRDAVLKWPQFGPWIAFKAADMSERLLRRDDVGDCTVELWYDEPLEGAVIAGTALCSDPRNGFAERYMAGSGLVLDDAKGVARFLLDDVRLRESIAPGRRARPLRLQEVETICCKYKAHSRGLYPVGHDIRALGRTLSAAAPISSTARDLLEVFDRRWKAWRE